MKTRTYARLLVALAVAAVVPFAHAQSGAPAKRVPALKVGDKAPAIKVAAFVKGDAFKAFPKDRFTVVEFWATWCGPCKQTIPHLTEISKKFGDKINVTGVSVWERPNGDDKNNLGGVKSFVAEMGDKMAYTVAVDTQDGDMAKNWMMAAGQDGIPTAFVVDPTGTIIWIGHPMTIEQPLAEMIAGKYDAKAAAEAAERAERERVEMGQLLAPLQAAAESGDPNKLLKEIDAIIAKRPAMESRLGMTRFSVLAQVDEAKAMAYAKVLGDTVLKDNAMGLNELAWSIIEPDAEFTKPDINLARDLAKKSVGMLKARDTNRAMVLDTLAYAEFLLGNKKEALAAQKEAIDILDALPKDQVDPDLRKELEERLKKYSS